MRLTVDLLRQAPQITNTLQQRELDLRGLRISSLDEHALVQLGDNFDCINLTANALTTLEYFPTSSLISVAATPQLQPPCRLTRVTTLIVHNNQLQKVSVPSCVRALPNVRHFLADRNQFKSVRDLLFLRHWPQLEIVSFELNPVWAQNPDGLTSEQLRAFLVFLCPKLKLINYERVTAADRTCATKHRLEFGTLVPSSDGVGSQVAGKKIRKRGRENREAGVAGGPAATGGEVQTLTDEMRRQRITELENRLTEATNEEEILALSNEMEELAAELEAAEKRRRLQ